MVAVLNNVIHIAPLPRKGALINYTCLDYRQSWIIQKQLVRDRIAQDQPDTLILLEHPPVYTVGRSGHAASLMRDTGLPQSSDIPLYYVERGGSITYHGPGQLIGYPILYLRQFCSGPRRFVFLLEEVLIRTLSEWGIQGRRLEQRPGVWVGTESPGKIASIGVHISRGVTMHGFSLNANVNLSPFESITPCGIADCQMTSMKDILHYPIPQSQLRSEIARIFGEVFGLSWMHMHSGQDLRGLSDQDILSPSTFESGQHNPMALGHDTSL